MLDKNKVFAALLLTLCIFGTTSRLRAESAAPSERYVKPRVLSIQSFYPVNGEVGIYQPGVAPQTELILSNVSQKQLKLDIEVSVKDYFDQSCGKVSLKTCLAPVEKKVIPITLPVTQKTGAFIATATVRAGSETILECQTCFCVIKAIDGKRDPFFMFDKNGLDPVFLNAGKIMGIGMIGVGVGWQNAARSPNRNAEKDAKKELKGYTWRKFIESDYALSIFAEPHLRQKLSPKEKARRNNGLYARDDSDYLYCREYFKNIASGLRGRAKFFLVQEEFDATILGMLPQSHTETLSNFVMVAKNVYAGIKEGNPESTLAVLGICMSDYYQSKPPFNLSRMILHDLGDSFDYVCVDGYSGNYDGLRGPLVPPERDFRKMLFDCADLSASFKRPNVVFNCERCFGVNYFEAFDTQTARDAANFTARSLVIAKSAPCPMYSIHLVRHWNVYLVEKQKAANRLPDYGLWKHVPNAKGKDARIPRSIVPAIATTAHELAFATMPREHVIDRQLYAYSFQGGGKNQGKRVVAIWSTQKKPLTATLRLPKPVKMVDLMGNSKEIPAGANSLVLTGAPVFLVTDASQNEIETMFKTVQFKREVAFSGYGRLVNAKTMEIHLQNQSAIPLDCEIILDQTCIGTASIPPFQRVMVPYAVKPDMNGLKEAALKFRRMDDIVTIPLDFRHQDVMFAGEKDYRKWSKMELRAPDHVSPVDATMPERGFFFYKGNDPYADLYLAWDKEGLHLAVEVNDKEHLQRNTGWNIWKDDCIQFGFHFENAKFIEEDRQKALNKCGGYNFAIAKTAKGVEFYRFYGGARGSGTIQGRTSVTRTGNLTCYKITVPWSELGDFSPKDGDAIGWQFVIFNNDNPKNPVAPYQFQLARGADWNVTKFHTLIFKGAPAK